MSQYHIVQSMIEGRENKEFFRFLTIQTPKFKINLLVFLNYKERNIFPGSKTKSSFPWVNVQDSASVGVLKKLVDLVMDRFQIPQLAFKGQLISEFLFVDLNFLNNQQKIWKISAQESKKWSNHKIKVFDTWNIESYKKLSWKYEKKCGRHLEVTC